MIMYETYMLYIVDILKLFFNVWEVFKWEKLGIYSITSHKILGMFLRYFNDKIIYILVHD